MLLLVAPISSSTEKPSIIIPSPVPNARSPSPKPKVSSTPIAAGKASSAFLSRRYFILTNLLLFTMQNWDAPLSPQAASVVPHTIPTSRAVTPASPVNGAATADSATEDSDAGIPVVAAKKTTTKADPTVASATGPIQSPDSPIDPPASSSKSKSTKQSKSATESDESDSPVRKPPAKKRKQVASSSSDSGSSSDEPKPKSRGTSAVPTRRGGTRQPLKRGGKKF